MAQAKTPSPAESSEASPEANGATSPTFIAQHGSVVISTWPKTVTTSNGKQRKTWVTTVSHRYRDGDNDKYMRQLFQEDLANAAVGLIIRAIELQTAKHPEEQADA